MSPLEKVPFATFYPLLKYLRSTCFFSKTTFSSGLIYWCSRVILCIQFYRLTQLILSTLLKGIIRKECQSFTNHGHDKTPPTVFNPLSLWLTLPRDMGVSHTQWPPSITRAILACLRFAQGLHKAQKNQNSRAVLWCSGWFYVFNFIDWCNLFFNAYLVRCK